jgi:hypothetical protein
MNIFDLQDNIFNYFLSDSNLVTDLSIVDITDMDNVKKKIRTSFGDPTLLTTDDDSVFPFFECSFVPSVATTNNYLLNRQPLQIRVYYLFETDKKTLAKAIDKILKNNFEDMQIISQGEYSTGAKDIYCWRITYRPFAFS